MLTSFRITLLSKETIAVADRTIVTERTADAAVEFPGPVITLVVVIARIVHRAITWLYLTRGRSRYGMFLIMKCDLISRNLRVLSKDAKYDIK
jgi:hypothetical protein